VFDSIVIRPLAYYLGPVMVDHIAVGWILGKLVSDIGLNRPDFPGGSGYWIPTRG